MGRLLMMVNLEHNHSWSSIVVIVAWSRDAGELWAMVPNTLFSICYDELCFTPVV